MSGLRAPILVNLFLTTAAGLAPAAAQTTGAAAAAPTGIVAEFKGTAANLERVAGETLTIDIRRWSTDDERGKLFTAYAQGAPQAAESMQKAESVGYIWRSGSGLGQSVRYAFDTKLPASGPGEGKFSSKIGTDAANRLLTIDGYEAAPVVMRGVTRAKR